MKRLTIFAVLGTVLSACTAGHRITRFDPNPHVGKGDQAAYYALPRTVVTVAAPVERTELKKGMCFDKLDEEATWLGSAPPPRLWVVIGLNDPEEFNFDPRFKLKDEVVLGNRAEPDPHEIFRVDLKSSAFKKRSLDLQFGSLGVLTSGTSSAQDKRLDIAVASFKSALDLVSELSAPLVPGLAPSPSLPKDPCHRAAYDIHQARQQLGTLRSSIANGNAVSGGSAQWLEEQIEADIARRLRAFLKEKETAGSIVCEVRPYKDDHPQKSYDIFRFSKDYGVEAASGTRCSIPEELHLSCPSDCDFESYRLRVSVVDDQLGEKLRKAGVQNAHNDSHEQGFFYRIPAVAQVVFENGSTSIEEEEMVVAQLGIVAALPRQKTYQSKYTVTLDPETGALQRLVSDSEAIDGSLVTDIGSGIGSYLEAEREREEARKAATDGLNLLERERKILEERKKIRDLKEDLGEADDGG